MLANILTCDHLYITCITVSSASCCFANKHKTHKKCYLVTAELPLTVNAIDCMRQTGLRKGA